MGTDECDCQIGSNSNPVAIVMPCHSWPDLLPEAVASIESQTVRPGLVRPDLGAVICVLDGPPEPDKYTQCFQDHYAITRIHLPQNLGAPAARNVGLDYADKAGYEWFVLLDEDDLLHPQFLEKMLLSSQVCPDRAIHYSDWIRFGDWHGYEKVPEYSYERLLQGPFMHPASLVKMEVWRDVRDKNGHGFDPALAGWQDWCFFCEAGALGHYGCRVGQALVRYRKHGCSISTTAHERLPEIVAYIKNKMRRLYNVEVTYEVKNGFCVRD